MWVNMKLPTVALVFLWVCISTSEVIPACDSEIYCTGPLLDTVQKAMIFPDSKTFVDMSLKDSPENVLAAFDTLANKTKESIEAFVSEYFSGPGDEFELWEPTDYETNPAFLNSVRDSNLRAFGRHLCKTWTHLGRKIKEEVKLNPDRHSLVYLPNPFIVPGGRFRETYYWDSYWVIKGLLVCGMDSTARGMLENFVELINRYGLIPNGGRIYYTRRSQPPLFIPMVHEYYKATQNLTFIQENIEHLEAEYSFWMTNRTISVNNDTYILNRYASVVNSPRPESYAEDVETVEHSHTGNDRELYSNIVSAAESGWDFSSRWFSREKGQNLTLDTIRTRDIVPVDLNSILCLNEKILSEFFNILGDEEKRSFYAERATNRSEAINNVFWNEERGIWQDLYHDSHRDYFYLSNIFPMFTACIPEDLALQKEKAVLKYLKDNKVTEYLGGIPTSLDQSGQQWDYPNVWPPLQHVVIWSLLNGGLSESKEMAFELAKTWIESNWIGWNRTGNMFEKYSALEPGTRGGGGEYDVQEGFGWTNGVILDILQRFGHRLVLKEAQREYCGNPYLQHGHCPSTCPNSVNHSGIAIPHMPYIILISAIAIFCTIFH